MWALDSQLDPPPTPHSPSHCLTERLLQVGCPWVPDALNSSKCGSQGPGDSLGPQDPGVPYQSPNLPIPSPVPRLVPRASRSSGIMRPTCGRSLCTTFPMRNPFAWKRSSATLLSPLPPGPSLFALPPIICSAAQCGRTVPLWSLPMLSNIAPDGDHRRVASTEQWPTKPPH